MNILEKAAQAVPGHWLKGIYGDNEGNYCLAGHIYSQMGYTVNEMNNGNIREDAEELLMLVHRVIDEQYNLDNVFIAGWNDEEDRTEDEVVAVLEKAAARLDERV